MLEMNMCVLENNKYVVHRANHLKTYPNTIINFACSINRNLLNKIAVRTELNFIKWNLGHEIITNVVM